MPTVSSRAGKALRNSRYMRRATRRAAFLAAGLSGLHKLRWTLTSREAIFEEVYNSRAWGSAESGSGTGSELRATGNVRDRLPTLLARLGAESLLDAPCGDWNWMQHVGLPVKRYFGLDIVPSVIEQNSARFGSADRKFIVADLTNDTLPRTDVILCRDFLVHVSFQDAALVLENFRESGAAWLLLNTYPEILHNRNQFTGGRWRRLNFCLPPFQFPEPMDVIPDGGDVDPSQLGLWQLQDLPRMATDGATCHTSG